MMNFNTVTLLFSCFISVTHSMFTTVEVQPGAEATLQCTNFSSLVDRISWFYVTYRANTTQICSMFSAEGNATYHTLQNDKFKMMSNTSTVFLKIKKVDSSDAGLYVCGQQIGNKIVIYMATFLKIQDGSLTNIYIIIMAGVIALLVTLVVGLLLKIWKLLRSRGTREEEKLHRQENVDSSEVTYATVNVHSKRRPSDVHLQTNVIYDATR